MGSFTVFHWVFVLLALGMMGGAIFVVAQLMKGRK